MGLRSRVLLVDDEEDYRRLFASALKDSGLDVDLFELTDGFAAIDYLLGRQPYADRTKFPFPTLVFLDLKMPGKDGFDVLNEIRKNLGQQTLPIVVLTNSGLKNDVAAAYSAQASAFHRKPSRYRDLVNLLRTIIPLWLDIRAPEIGPEMRRLSHPAADTGTLPHNPFPCTPHPVPLPIGWERAKPRPYWPMGWQDPTKPDRGLRRGQGKKAPGHPKSFSIRRLSS